MPALTTSIQHCTRGPGMCNKTSKRNKRYKGQKRESKTLFAHDMCVYVFLIQKKYTGKLLELINGFGKIAGLTRLIHKNQVFSVY